MSMSIVAIARMAVAAACLAGCAPEPPDERGRSARGIATGATGAAADSMAAAAARGDLPASPSVDTPLASLPDSTWTTGRVEVSREMRRVAVLSDVRVASHDGFDRIVLDFGDAAAPGYRIEYVDRPVRACGSGEVVELPGDGWLAIDLRPAAAHDDRGYATVQSRDLAADLPVIQRLRSTCDFEAVVQWVAAVRSPNRFRVTELTRPTRLVVDIRH